MRSVMLTGLALLVSCASVPQSRQFSLTEGDLTVFFAQPQGWLGSYRDPRGFYEFYPGKDFSRVALTVGFSELRSEDLSSLPAADRDLFEQDSLSEQYVRQARQEGFSATGITIDSVTAAPRPLRIYLSVSNVSRLLTFIPFRGHVVQVCMYSSGDVSDLVAHKSAYVQFLASIHPQ
jgi:hypothetical protein